ncbi:MAG: hybrid sensor histidine kinase/response regulator [Chloroflexi bacterium]|nr:hybrid sensor histidine kinase/response regulator [Chloroflexota bacterium]
MMNSLSHTILIVDDLADNLKLVAGYLQEHDFRLLMARSGEGCIQRAIHGDPDLILLDVLMPTMDGFETCQKLKADERLRHIPVIFMTALTELEDKIKGFAVGAVDYIVKPIREEELLARITTHLRIRDLTQNLEILVASRTEELTHSLERERYLAQELQQSLAKETELAQLRAQIIETISHEFRAPLTAINQSATLLGKYYDRLSKEKRQNNFARMTESVFMIDKLLRNILTVHQIDTKETLMVKTAVSYVHFCTTLQEHLQSEFPTTNHLLTFITAESEREINIDIHLVQQVLVELIGNAFKFSEPDNSVTVTITLQQTMLSIVVADKGIGVPIAAQLLIFDLFARATNVDARRGLGIGLYIAKRLTEKMNGRLSVESTDEKQGSTFTLQLPLTYSDIIS